MGWKTGKTEKKDEPKVMARQDFSDEKIGPKFDVEKKEKPKAKPTTKKLKDTSGDYWSADGLSGDIGSVDAEEGSGPKFKKGGSVSSASRRADGIAIRGKTRA